MKTRTRRRPRLFLLLLPISVAMAILLLSSRPCFAADIQPPTDEEVDEFARGSILYEEGWSIHEIIKMHKITKQGGELEVYYYLYVVYTATLPAKDDPETFYAHAAYETGVWKSSAGGPTVYQSGYYGAPYRAAESMGDALSALDGAMQELFDIIGVEPGWPVVSPDGKIVSPGSAGTTRTGGGKKIPGPGSWWKWLTGAVIPAAIAAGASLVTSVMGGAAPPAGPPAPSTAGGPKVPQPPPKAGGEPRGKPPAGKKPRRPGQRTPGGLLDFPGEAQPFPADIAAGTAGIVEPESAVKVTLESSAAVKDGMGPAQDVAAGTADPFDLQKYPNQPGYIGDVVNENLTAAQDAVSPTVADASVALKDGVIGFVKGVASIPITALEGFVQIGRLLAETHTELTQGGTGLFKDMTSPSVLWDTLKNISIPLGKALPELLPIEEFKSFFDSNASLEEKLWAIPSAVVKIANLIMMSEKLATKPVPGLPPMSTFIKSAKPGLAAEAALNSTDPAVQKAYDSYRKAGEAKAAGIRDTVTKGGKVSQEQVLDAMSDPATMRNIKKAPEAVQKEFNLTQTREVYQPVYKDVTSYMEGKYPGEKFRVGSVRTPGQKSLINTDNDAVVERLTYTRDGMPYWKEVPAKEWEHAYYESFSKRTGFTPEKAKARFPEKDWDSMTPQQQHKAWTEGHGQECMDVKNPEAAHAFSDQPTAMDPKWRPGRGSPVSQERIVDGEGLGHMERFKTGRGWKGPEATLRTQTEAMEQGCKLCGLSKKLAQQSMKRTGKVIEYPEVFKQGEEILNMRNLSPQVRDQALKNIGFEGGYEEFMDKLSSWTGALP